MFNIGIEELIRLVCVLALGFYFGLLYAGVQKRFGKKRTEARKAQREASRERIVGLIREAVEAEDKAIATFQEALERVREIGVVELHESWKQMMDIRNNLNRYSGLCGQIEEASGGSLRAEMMIRRFRCGQDPFGPKPKKSGPKRKAAPK